MFPIYSNLWDRKARKRFTPAELSLIEERERMADRCQELASRFANTKRGATYQAEADKWRSAARDARAGKFLPVK